MSTNNPNVGDVVFRAGQPVGLFLAGAEPVQTFDFADPLPLTAEQRGAVRAMLQGLRAGSVQALTPSPSPLREALEREAGKPALPEARRLAIAVLLGEEDAVWPLIDTIVEARDRPDLPTYGELLAALRERAEVLDEKGGHDYWDWDRRIANDAAIPALVKRCLGVAT